MEQFSTYYTAALKYLSFRPRSEKEITDFLIKKKTPQILIATVIEKLKKEKFLDDAAFVAWWIEQRTTFRKKSVRVIEIELKQKGISPDLIKESLQDPKILLQSDLTRAIEIVQAKIGKYTGYSSYDISSKLGQLLLRKGFDYETSKQAIDAVMRKTV